MSRQLKRVTVKKLVAEISKWDGGLIILGKHTFFFFAQQLLKMRKQSRVEQPRGLIE